MVGLILQDFYWQLADVLGSNICYIYFGKMKEIKIKICSKIHILRGRGRGQQISWFCLAFCQAGLHLNYVNLETSRYE